MLLKGSATSGTLPAARSPAARSLQGCPMLAPVPAALHSRNGESWSAIIKQGPFVGNSAQLITLNDE